MLAWVTNTPRPHRRPAGLVPVLVRRGAPGRPWCQVSPSTVDWRQASSPPTRSGPRALRVDLGRFMRTRFAAYVQALAEMARDSGIRGVPFLVNIHGTEGGNGVPFAIGISQLVETLCGRAGRRRRFGPLPGRHDASARRPTSTSSTPAMAAVNGPDQPVTSLEFEAGTGDYGGGARPARTTRRPTDLKTRLCLAQGNRMVNYYLLAGGINPPLDAAGRRRQRPDQLHRRAARHGRADRPARGARDRFRAHRPGRAAPWPRTAAGWPTWTRSTTTSRWGSCSTPS